MKHNFPALGRKKWQPFLLHHVLVLLIPFFVSVPQTLLSQREVHSSMNWETGIFSLSVEADRTRKQYNRPASFYGAEQQIERVAAQLIFNNLLDVQVDSYSNLADLAKQDPGLLQIIDSLSAKAVMTTIRPGREMKKIQGSYELNLYPTLSQTLVKHKSPFPMVEILEWQPGSQYSGVVIYARHELSVYGEGDDDTAFLQPALFPAIYDANMRLLVDRNRMDPEYVKKWGGSAYSTSLAENRERVGDNPFRILAVGVFGINPSDPLIPVQDANILLHANQQLLREARILIVITEPEE